MGIKGNLIGHTGYIESDTAIYLKALEDVGSEYQPVYLKKIGEQEGADVKKGEITVCNYNDVYNNVQVGPFVLQSSIEYSDYPYSCDFMDNRITSQTYAQCILSAEDAGSGIISPIVNTFTGLIRLYANQSLETITIKTLALFNLHKNTDMSQVIEG